VNPLNHNNDSWKKKIALFLTSQNLSIFGSSVVSFSIIFFITVETSSGKWVTAFTICALLPQVLISLWAGVWADRYNRKTLIMVSDGLIAVITLGLAAAFWAGYQRLELLLAVSFFRSVCAGIQMPAVMAVFPQIVPVERLTKVQGINQTLNSVLMLLSPAVGGVVLGSLGIVWVLFVDVITALLAVAILSFISIEKVVRSGEVTTVLTDLRQGIGYAFSNELVRRLLICYGISFILITPAAFLTPLFVERVYGGDIWRLTANEMVWTVGSLIGGVFVSLRGEFKDKIRTISICLVSFGVAFALLGVSPNFIIYLVIMGAAGVFMPVIATAETVLIQEKVETEMMGRVFSLLQIISGGAMPIAILFFGPLADIVPISLILLVSGVLLALTGVLFQVTTKRAGLIEAE
jgi:DHA3 family macrolide efflux protein-like MFS transporter